MKRFILAGAGVVLAAAVVWWVVQREPSTPQPTRPPPVLAMPPPSAAAAPTNPVIGVGCRFTVGQTLSFDVSSEISVRLSPEVARFGGSDAPRDAVTTARLTFEVLRTDDFGAVLLARATGLEATGGEEVKAPWLARINERCEIAGYARHVTTTRGAGRQQQALLHELWFTLPGATPRQVSFDNSTGAAVGQVLAGEGQSLTRTIERYQRAFLPSMNGVDVKSSRLEVKRGEAPWFESMHGVEETSVSGIVSNGRSELTVSARPADAAVLATASRNEADYVWQNLLGGTPDGSLRSNSMPEDHHARMEAMKTFTLPMALAQMTGLMASGANMDTQWRDMAAFLDEHPEEIPEFAEVVVTDFPPPWKGIGYLTLSHTESVEARELLLTILREQNAPSVDRVRASLALVTRHDVGLPLARELIAESKRTTGTKDQQEYAHQALLYAGMLSGLRVEEKPIRDEVYRALASELSRTTWQELAVVYSAIGNTGDPTFLPDIDRASRHPDPDVRATVPIALRRMPLGSVRDFELAWLRRETSPDVMRELFSVIHRQHQDLGQPISDELATEAVHYLRRQPHLLTRQVILMMLQPWVALRPDVRAAFRDQLKVEYEATSGLFPYVAGSLPEEDVEAALATIPSLGDQYGTISSSPTPDFAQTPPRLSTGTTGVTP